jgi:hypothetical protein
MAQSSIYLAHHVPADLVIDGNLAKPAWQLAPAVELRETVTGAPPVAPTTARLVWSDTHLYAAFHCEHSEFNARLTHFNDTIYNEEVVEVFVDDDGDLKTYLEFEVSPLNTVLHYEIHNDLAGRVLPYARVHNYVVSQVVLDHARHCYDVELAMPFTEIITGPHCPPRVGDEWRLNLYRINRPQDDPDEYTAWQPTGALQYHLPSCFGTLRFAPEL